MRILLSLRAASASAERKSYRGILGLRHRLQKREFRRLGFCVEAEMAPAMIWENDALKTGPERCILRRSVVCCGSARKPVGNPRLGCVRPKRKSRLTHSIERS